MERSGSLYKKIYFLYSLKTDILSGLIKNHKHFLYSLKIEILADFIKNYDSCIFSGNRNSSTLYKKSKLPFYSTETEINQSSSYSRTTEMSKISL